MKVWEHIKKLRNIVKSTFRALLSLGYAAFYTDDENPDETVFILAAFVLNLYKNLYSKFIIELIST